MLHRILIPALLVPLLGLAAPKPASAQFDFGSWIQRATIIANQITQIRNQVSQIRSMASQLTELEDQLDHMERAARGEIDALLAPFSRLAAEPVGLVRDGLGWGSDFTGAARQTVDAVRDFGRGGRSFTGLWRSAQGAADRVSEGDILALYRDLPPAAATRAAEDYRRARLAADRRRALDYATLDAAAALAETVESAQSSFAGLAANGNLSRVDVSRCVRWLIGSRAFEMPPELPQTCSCPRHPLAPPRCLSGAGCARSPSPKLATTSRVLVRHTKHYGTNARMIPGFTSEKKETER
ncbi:MAG: hypothetical protein OXH49_00755 [Gemmatimonadetes bacterium]|nr:hypothetical protein [Gemmatimonadota bacterium]